MFFLPEVSGQISKWRMVLFSREFLGLKIKDCLDPAISLHAHYVSLVQWTTRLLPVSRDPGSNPWGDLCETGILLLALSRYRMLLCYYNSFPYPFSGNDWENTNWSKLPRISDTNLYNYWVFVKIFYCFSLSSSRPVLPYYEWANLFSWYNLFK
jgi:hypothetical protein